MAETKESRQAKYLERNGLVQINMTIPIEVRDMWKKEAIDRGMSIKQMLISMFNAYLDYEQMLIGMVDAYLDYEKMERKQAQNAIYGQIAKSEEGDK